MPGKSRRSKRKHLTTGQERRERQSSLDITKRQSIQSKSVEFAPAGAVDSKGKIPIPRATSRIDAASYVKKELLGISVLSLIMILLTIVLWLALR